LLNPVLLEDARMNTMLTQAARTALTQRVTEDAIYTNGHDYAEVTQVLPMGYIWLRYMETGRKQGYGIVAFRREWWRVH
jgi:hypothetical protein